MKQTIKKILGIKVYESTESDVVAESVHHTPAPEAIYYNSGGNYTPIYTHVFDGEKTAGDAGPIKHYIVDNEALRARSWQMYLDSEICQTVIKRFVRWVIGNGLKLQAEPQKTILESEKITLDAEAFNKTVEARFKVYSNSSMADYSNNVSLHKLAERTFENAIVGGDLLVILRYIAGAVKVQLIDGCHIVNPMGLGYNGCEFTTTNGNVVRHGIELSPSGEPIAYYVRTEPLKTERIPARGKSGALMAFVVRGLEYRLDNVRSIPLLSAVMETAAKMGRYKEATLGTAEELAKITVAIIHGSQSSGENPLINKLQQDQGYTKKGDIATNVNGVELENKFKATTGKQAINLPIDADLKTIDGKGEINFKEFYEVNIDLVCATVGIPPNVAMSKYDSNFSASRAALKDWEHTLMVERKKFADQFYQKIYNFFLEVEILNNKVQAPGYIMAVAQGNEMVLAAYRFARFVGANVPHIDPEKEVRAQRLMLGDGSTHVPLTTVEAATEALNNGDYTANAEQYAEELEHAETEGIEKMEVMPPGGNNNNEKPKDE